MISNVPRDTLDTLPPPKPLRDVVLVLLSVVLGALGAVVLLPVLLPGLGATLVGVEPKVFWFMSRASGFAAFGMLWLSMVVGLSMTNKLARLWPGAPTAFDLHQYFSLFGLALALFHGLILLGDRYMDPTIVQLALPFANAEYRPIPVGLGQLGFYLLAIIAFSFYVRRRIGPHAWRLLHFGSFLAFALSLAHALLSGTDTGTMVATATYWGSAGSVLFLAVYRVLMSRCGR